MGQIGATCLDRALLLELNFLQPLLRGGGIETNTASIKIANATDQFNILSLKSTLIDTVTFNGIPRDCRD